MVLSLRCLHCYLGSFKQQQSRGPLDLLTHSVIREILNFFHGELFFCLHSFPRAQSQVTRTLSERGQCVEASSFPCGAESLSYLSHQISPKASRKTKRHIGIQSPCSWSAAIQILDTWGKKNHKKRMLDTCVHKAEKICSEDMEIIFIVNKTYLLFTTQNEIC